MLLHKTTYAIHFRFIEAKVSGHGNWLQPEFYLQIIAGDMDMRWLPVFPTIKMESVWTDAKHRWHTNIITIATPAKCAT